MDTPHSDLEAIRQILADLTTRVYRIERKLEMDATAPDMRPAVAGPAPLTRSAETSSVPMPPDTQVPRVARDDRVVPPLAPYAVSAQSSVPPRPSAVRPSNVLRGQPDPDLEARIGSRL